MSRDNVEVVRRLFEAWMARDVEAFVELHHPDAEIMLPRNLLEGGSYRGTDGARRAFQDGWDSWDDIQGEFADVREVGEHVIALGRAANVGKGGGPRVEYDLAWVVRLRDGRVVYSRPYLSHQEALEAVATDG